MSEYLQQRRRSGSVKMFTAGACSISSSTEKNSLQCRCSISILRACARCRRRGKTSAIFPTAERRVKATAEPTQADIDKYHGLFVAELQRIFEKYKGPYGWGDKKLIIK